MVSVRDLRKRYGPVEAVRGISFEIQRGEIFGLLGPNGAGKTTTIECILGLRKPDAGTIEIAGLDARRDPAAVRERVGAALQTTALHDRITPREALRLFSSFYRRPVDPERLLERFSLTGKADEAVDGLSGGQKQRLALALAFVNAPELVFLDEPTAGLDARSRRELHDEIRRMRDDGHTVLLTTHLLEEAEQLCDRIAIVDRGRIVAIGAPQELVAGSARRHRIVLRTDRPVPADLLQAVAGVAAPTGETDTPSPPAAAAAGRSNELTLQTESAGPTLLALLGALDAHGIALEELHVQRATLEDVFIDLTDATAAERAS
jgi:ABC-2 type transport system ATP-binding protein